MTTRPGRCVLAGLGLSLAAAGCGSSHIVLQVTSTLLIPAQTNHLEVLLRTPDLRELADSDQALRLGQAFPLRIGLDPSADAPRDLVVRVSAMLDDQLVARAEPHFHWDPGNEIDVGPVALNP